VAVADGVLSVLLIGAFLLIRPWRQKVDNP
jgi:hypothetical protein